jgi:LmbE family N-acetylglucosaminyl deacetylase
MHRIYLSPHFDDAALSCGGLIWEQVRQGEEVRVWTICAGEPPPGEMSAFADELHTRWQVSAAQVLETRRREDAAAMAILGVPYEYFTLPDAIYRRDPRTGEPLYPSVEALFDGLQPGEQDIWQRLAIEMASRLPAGPVRLVLPLGVGNHADHLLVRQAAETLPVSHWYYPDYPYTRTYPQEHLALVPRGMVGHAFPVSPAGLAAWQDSVAAYASQLSSFWLSVEDMRQDLTRHSGLFSGVTLFGPPENNA